MMQHRGDSGVAAVAFDSCHQSNPCSAASLAENESGCSGHQADQRSLLPLAAVLGDSQRVDARGAEREHRGAAPVGTTIRTSDHDSEITDAG